MAASKLKARDPLLVEPGKTKGLVFGASGAGKTWFSLSFPAPYYIDTEGGADLRHYQQRLKAAGGAYMGPDDGALDFATIIEQIQALATEKHNFKTVIIDSITKVYQVAIANEAERLGNKDVFAASKKPAIAWMRRLVNWITKLDMNVWFIAHEAPEWGENKTTGQREEIGKIPDVWDKLVYELDIGIRVVRRGETYPVIGLVHKSRLMGFPQGSSFPLDYSSFAERYGKDYIESVSKPIILATSEQVSEITRLVDLLKISEDDCEKVLTKAGAEKWSELKTEQATEMLTRLNAKLTGGK